MPYHYDDRVFVERVDATAQALGKSRAQILREAGLSRARLGKRPDKGRVIDIFGKVMGPLEWLPADVLRVISDCFGWDWPLLRGYPDLVEHLPTTSLYVYNVLAERAHVGEPIDESYLSGIVDSIRHRVHR